MQMNLTLGEQERAAYQQGNMREVELLGEALGVASEDEIATLEEEAYERGKSDGIEEKRDAMLHGTHQYPGPARRYLRRNL